MPKSKYTRNTCNNGIFFLYLISTDSIEYGLDRLVHSLIGDVTINLWKRRIKRDKCLRNACQ